ncbi:hypothetical protein NMG60_11016919, partial [Bertholletia excelsa]
NYHNPQYLEMLDYLDLLQDDAVSSFTTTTVSLSQSQSQSPAMQDGSFESASFNPLIDLDPMNNDYNHMQVNGMKKARVDVGRRIAFRTKSDLEIMDDGFKWRKYGKKKVKSSPNPRNYYKCSNEGCNVKKRIERDREDPSYVITTYEGTHNHESPCAIYCNQTPFPFSSLWTLQASDYSC